MSFWEHLENIRIDKDTNIHSYVTLKGVLAIKYKLRREGELKYANAKRKLVEDVCQFSKNCNLAHVEGMLQEIRDALLHVGYEIKICKIKTSGRTLIGASEPFGKVPFEVGLPIDTILNVPFIPGSSLKGAFRNALQDLLEKEGKSRKEAEEVARIIFGSEEWSGLLGVTDAYPIKLGVNGFLFEPDVVTPHYPKAKTELDAEPNPVPFLTIARDVVFEFYIYFNKFIYCEEDKWLKKHKRRTKRKYAVLGSVRNLAATRFMRGSVDELVSNAFFRGDLGEEVNKLENRGVKFVEALPYVDRAVLYAFARGVGAKTSLGYSRFGVLEYRSL